MEMVVASSNNGAVENVTTEIPKAIDPQFTAIDYFAETARTVHGDDAWAMIAAKLGNRKNRNEFADKFWWKSMRHILRQPPSPDWPSAVGQFRTALARVHSLSTERRVVAQAVSALSRTAAERENAALAVQVASSWFGSMLAGRKLAKLTKECDRLTPITEDGVRHWGEHVPVGPVSTEQREKSAPWADPELAGARSELFLSALALHKAFILANAPIVAANLNAMADILAGKGHPQPEATMAAWQTLFLVVPVVSSTFASFDRLFSGVGREALGWLFIDEAGQAAPQNAVGALWRSRRAVIVGDPLQLEPVVTLPGEGQRTLLRAFDVTESWAPSPHVRAADRRPARELRDPAGQLRVGSVHLGRHAPVPPRRGEGREDP